MDDFSVDETPKPSSSKTKAPSSRAKTKTNPKVIQWDKIIGDRTPPHNIDMEQALLACIILEGGQKSIPLCVQENIIVESFYSGQHQLIYASMIRLYEAGVCPINEVLLIDQLRKDDALEQAGGDAYLIPLTNRIDTPVGLQHYVDRVRDAHMLRQIIQSSNEAIERVFADQSDVTSILSATRSKFEAISKGNNIDAGRSLDEFEIPDPDDPSILLGNRYVCRGHGGIIAAPSGVGKSTISVQMQMYWACGRDFMGIAPHGPLRSLAFQAEDDDGDIGEAYHSCLAFGNFTEEERRLIRNNVRFIRNKTDRGERFISALYRAIQSYKPDLVWINPLHAYMEGDISKADDAGRFLREQLNMVNREERFAYMIIHHTTKPTKEKSQESNWNEIMYEMSGSSELINWARFIISLKAKKSAGKFKLHLAKRGKRAGVTRQVNEAQFAQEVVTEIGIEHCKQTFEYKGRQIPGLFWMQSEQNDDEEDTKEEGNKRSGKSLYKEAEVLKLFPAGYNAREKIGVIQKTALTALGMKPSAFYEWRGKLLDQGKITQDDKDNRYYR